MKRHYPVEYWLRLGTGTVLWAISSLLTGGLFLQFAAGDAVKQVVLLCLACGLEGAKILSWRMGKAYRVLAVSLICLSILASFGAAIQTVDEMSQSTLSVVTSPTQAIATSQSDSLQKQINILMNRLDALPPDFTSAAARLNQDIEALRQRLDKHTTQVQADLQAMAAEPQTKTMFDLIAHSLGLPVNVVMMAILLFLAVNLEVAALVLAGSRDSIPKVSDPDTVVGSGSTYTPFHNLRMQVSTQAFLEAMMLGADLPFLNGRDKTARALGITPYEAKVHFRDLVDSGLIKQSGRRMKLVHSSTDSPPVPPQA